MSDETSPKAIETRYGGYRFRSRLEARWAVFMDTLGVKYEYEKEGYELEIDPSAEGSQRVRYLPDFWLPELECFVEIKGAEPEYEELCKPEALAMATGHAVYVFHGDCWLPDWSLNPKRHALSAQVYARTTYRQPAEDGDAERVWVFQEDQHWWCVCPWCDRLGIERQGDAGRLPCGCVRRANSGVMTHQPTYWYPRIVEALTAARSARFEFGEKGR